MVDTRSVSDDQGRSGISLCLGDGLDSLVLISAHGDLCYIYIAIAHCHSGQILLNGFLTVCGELCDSAFRSSLGGLSACVGVNFCVEAEYVDILAGSQNVVNTAVADIECPAVTAEDPVGLLGQELLILEDLKSFRGTVSSQSRYQLVSSRAVGRANLVGVDPFFGSCLDIIAGCLSQSLDFAFQFVTKSLLAQEHTETEFSGILEQGVGPCGTEASLVQSIRSGRRGVAPDGGTSCRVGDVHSVAEQLSDQLRVRCLTAACARA